GLDLLGLAQPEAGGDEPEVVEELPAALRDGEGEVDDEGHDGPREVDGAAGPDVPELEDAARDLGRGLRLGGVERLLAQLIDVGLRRVVERAADAGDDRGVTLRLGLFRLGAGAAVVHPRGAGAL